jgi:hypothetical protein
MRMEAGAPARCVEAAPGGQIMTTMRTLAICSAIFGLGCLVGAQSLGEAARRAKEKRKAPDGAKTLTQDDLDRAREARRDTAPAEPAATASPTGSHPAVQIEFPAESRSSSVAPRPADSPASDMAALERKIRTWRERYRPFKANVERIEREIVALEAARSRPWGPLRTTNPYAEGNLANARGRLAEAQKKLDEIVEQARQDGVTSGQLY